MHSETDVLASGLGVCTPSHLLAIRASEATVQLGAYPDLLRTVFGAVHRANRHSGTAGYAALALPDAGGGRGLDALGQRILILGTKEVLTAVLNDPELERLRKRGLFNGRVREHDPDGVTEGHVLVRSRHAEKRVVGSGLAARRARRAEKRHGGTPPEPRLREKTAFERLTGFVTLKAGRRIDFIARRAPWTGEEIKVTTYGLSRMTEPMVLPVA